MTRDAVYLRHILDAIAKVEQYTSVGQETFLDETHWQDAVIRQLEVIGEATKRLSAEIREREGDVPWRRIAGLRDVLIHDYMSVDIEAVWRITETELPALRARVESILGSLDAD